MSYPRAIQRALAIAPVLLAAIMAIGMSAPPATAAQFGISGFDGEVSKPDGSPDSQAGATPFQAFGMARFNVDDGPDPLYSRYRPVESTRHIYIDLPPGFIGNPEAQPKCSSWELFGTPRLLANPLLNNANCQLASQVGAVGINGPVGTIPAFGSAPADPHGLPSWFALYNLEPPPGKVAAFGANFVGIPLVLTAEVRPDDYGVRVSVENISQAASPLVSGLAIWGVPADPSHDMLRVGYQGTDRLQSLKQGQGQPVPTTEFPDDPTKAVRVGVAPRPFLRNPTACTPEGVGLETRMHAVSWFGSEDRASFFSHHPAPNQDQQIGPTGCDRLPFDPDLSGGPRTSRTGVPAGFDFEITVPHVENVAGIGQADLKKAVVTLPEGVAISPSAADGLAACADEQLRVGLDGPAECPAGSKIGAVSVQTPLLDKVLHGSVYVRSQNSDDPGSGEMFRVAIEIRDDERGIYIKLPGRVRVDAGTGRIQAEFDNNPQVPFSRLRVELKGGPRAPLVVSEQCGTHRITAEFTSWGGQSRTVSAPFELDEGCEPHGFAPGFSAGALTPTGGRFSPFVARIDRADGDQFLSGLTVDLPEGLLAKVAGVEKCGSAAAENGGCPAGSRIGTATAGAGAGSNPFYVRGDVFLTEGYKGAPYGMAVHVHAKAGPFDLGWVRVRQALHVDRTTARVSAVSDPLPQIVKGVPVRLRSVDVDVDRADFTINPTSCDEKRVAATFTSIDGAVHSTASRFQAGDCQALPFKPRLGLRLTGKRQRTTGRHPGVKAVVRQTGIGEAGIEKAKVTLPRSLALDPDNAQALCEYEDGIKPDLESHCPKGSIVGRARARTPLLDRDLVGDVYFVKNVRRDPETGNEIRTLPMIVVALRGEIAINLYGRSSTARNGRLVNTFAEVPDAPITRFNLNIKGGSNGILAVTRTHRAKINLCTNPRGHIATNWMNGHNGKQANHRVRVKTPCGKAGKAKAGKKAKAKRK